MQSKLSDEFGIPFRRSSHDNEDSAPGGIALLTFYSYTHESSLCSYRLSNNHHLLVVNHKFFLFDTAFVMFVVQHHCPMASIGTKHYFPSGAPRELLMSSPNELSHPFHTLPALLSSVVEKGAAVHRLFATVWQTTKR